ncbi:olfactory receptor 52K1-like [Carettochelys insculpta]|uniref:olfactory receptor 52K1-like n=1 Tax=Carettochelys insculpta TaxID=44489 RepID=UPI003EBEF1E7
METFGRAQGNTASHERGTLKTSEPHHHIKHLMVAFNLSHCDPSIFTLMGIPGLEAAQVWISIPFSMFYIIGLLGNFMVLFTVGKEQILHKPMYLLLCMLALTDIATPTFVVPKALCIFWFNLKDITVSGCLTQMFFLHAVSLMHSAVLVTMAFDRYVAISDPLRYSTILTKAEIAKLVLVGLTRAVLFILPLPLLLSRQPFCSNRFIPHIQCEHISVVKMSCGDISAIKTYGLVLFFIVNGVDLTLIALSYGHIIRAVLRISSKEAHQKTLNTCTAHLCVMLMYYTPSLVNNLTNWFNKHIEPQINIILTDLYLLVPPMLNPIIYGVKTTELREKMGKYTCKW